MADIITAVSTATTLSEHWVTAIMGALGLGILLLAANAVRKAVKNSQKNYGRNF